MPKSTSLTADQFVASVVDFDGLPPATQTDLLALYLVEHAAQPVTASAIASLRAALHLSPQSRLPQYLSEHTRKRGPKPGHYVKTKLGYALERGFSKQLQATHLGRTAAKNVATSLRGTLAAISDPSVKAYLEEAIRCFEQNLLRSSIVMTWCVAFGLFRSWLFRNHLAKMNGAMALWKTPVTIAKLDDFQDLTEATVVDTARKVGIISKEQHKTLRHLLDQRNSYAHPTPKAITPSMSEAYIEIVLKEVLPHFG